MSGTEREASRGPVEKSSSSKGSALSSSPQPLVSFGGTAGGASDISGRAKAASSATGELGVPRSRALAATSS